jgi:hypothetical protein
MWHGPNIATCLTSVPSAAFPGYGRRRADCSRCSRAQPPEHRRDHPTGQAHRGDRPVGFRQIVPGVRHHLRRRTTSLRRIAVGIRAPVSRVDGKARRRLHRGVVAGHFDRAEDRGTQPAFNGRHGNGDLRLSPPVVGARRNAALPELRATGAASECRTDRRDRARLAARRQDRSPRAARAGTQGRVPRAVRKRAQTGFHPCARRRRAHRSRIPAKAEPSPEPHHLSHRRSTLRTVRRSRSAKSRTRTRELPRSFPSAMAVRIVASRYRSSSRATSPSTRLSAPARRAADSARGVG